MQWSFCEAPKVKTSKAGEAPRKREGLQQGRFAYVSRVGKRDVLTQRRTLFLLGGDAVESS